MNAELNEIIVSLLARPRGCRAVVDDVEQMMVVKGVNLDEHVIVTSGIMTFYHFGNFPQLIYNLIELLRVFQVKPHVGACLIADFLRGR